MAESLLDNLDGEDQEMLEEIRGLARHSARVLFNIAYLATHVTGTVVSRKESMVDAENLMVSLVDKICELALKEK